jgi:glyoxylase-like metal-dependent hydrolase (beta-lactamase superfamily II)
VNWTIEPIALHRVLVPGPEVLFQRAFAEMIELTIYAFILRGSEHVYLVDTGLPRNYEVLNQSIRSRKGHSSGFIDVGARLQERLAASHVKLDGIILTSFGPYAVGGLHEVQNAPVFLSHRGIEDLERPEEPALRHPVPPESRPRLLAGSPVRSRHEIMPGLVMEEVGIHHPACANLEITTRDGVVGISDPVFHRRNLLEGCALGAAEEAGRWHRMVRMLARNCHAVIPIHDPDPTPLARDLWHGSLRNE